MQIDIYTDGCCKGNPGHGGYGYIIHIPTILDFIGYDYEDNTTNNRMELKAVIEAINMLRTLVLDGVINSDNLEIKLYSDSKYFCDSINKEWLRSWISKDFKGIKNSDLWRELTLTCLLKDCVEVIWVAGHSGNKYNELADSLANVAYESRTKEALLTKYK